MPRFATPYDVRDAIVADAAPMAVSRIAAGQEAPMFKSIHVPLFGSERDKPALDAGLGVARLFDARLDCVHVRPDPRLVVATMSSSMEPGGVVVSQDLLNSLVEADKNSAARARNAFDAFSRGNNLEPARTPFALSASFREIVADSQISVVSMARFADVTVFAPLGDTGPWGLISDTIVGAGRPVLLAPVAPAGMSAPAVTIAWKDTAESARAVAAAMPLLAKARQVNVISACESEGAMKASQESANALAALLKGHGFATQAECIDCTKDNPAHVLLERAVALKSSLVVAGAYGNARLRQFIFGGFTQFMLRQQSLPVFLQH
jgi:nucleotide-binding universal stress UspA family protein